MKRWMVVLTLIVVSLLAAPVMAGEAHDLQNDVLLNADLSIEASWTSDGSETGGWHGHAVALAGDVDGNGYPDVIFGAPKEGGLVDREGVVYLFEGGPNGLGDAAAWQSGGGQSGARYGCSVDGAGDIDGDGYDDVVIGAYRYHDDYPENTSEEGMIAVFYGSPDGLSAEADWTFQSDFDNAQLGYSVSGAGDVNNDGYADVIAGARYYSQTIKSEGGALVFYGSPDGLGDAPDWIATSGQSGSGFGGAVSAAGDINVDGYDDVIVGAHGYDSSGLEDNGAAFVYLGSEEGLLGTPAWQLFGEQAGVFFGTAVAGAGDVNGDQLADILVSAPEYGADENDLMRGMVYVFYGASSAGQSDQAIMRSSFVGEGDLGRFGFALAAAGDPNKDGYADVLVGADQYDGDQPDEGRVYIFPGGPSGLAPAPIWQAEGNKADASFGFSLAEGGDINGDGLIDVIVGAPLYRLNLTNVGRVFAFYGQPGYYANAAQIFLPVIVSQQ